MSVPAFTDITVEEQTSAIRSYLKSLGATIAEENTDDGFEKDLHHIIGCCDVCFEKGTDAETESVFNSIVSLLVTVPTEKGEDLVVSFCQKLAKAPNNKLALVSLRVLSNLFQGLDECSPLRYNVYYYMVKVAGITGSILTVFIDVDKMKRWMKHCDVSTDKLQRILRLLHEILLACKHSDLASKVMVELLGTYTEDNASQARDEAHRCIVASLGDSNTFLLDHLLTLKPVKFLEGEPIHDLLTIFVSEKLSVYVDFYNARKDFVDSLGLRHSQNMQKMMLLTFMQIAETRKEIPYDVLQQELQIGSDTVEMFVIDALRTKMIQAKVDQLNRRVIISSTIHRTFGKPQWQFLREVLAQWKIGVSRVNGNMENVLGVHFTQPPPPNPTKSNFEVQGRVVGDAPEVHLIGDSIVRGVRVGKPGWTITWCYPGIRIENVTTRMEGLLGKSCDNPVVVLHVGAGNIKMYDTPAEIGELFHHLVKTVRHIRPMARIALSCITPVFYRARDYDGFPVFDMPLIVQEMRRVCSLEGLTFVNASSHLLADPEKYYRRDGLHLSDEGKLVFGSVLKKAVNGLIRGIFLESPGKLRKYLVFTEMSIAGKAPKRGQPAWTKPALPDAPKLKLYNSLTRQKEEFIPQSSNRVLWYSCGPTTYDASHMGHARSYISFDILRRVLADYFNYNVIYVMNVTDIDDKIIRRARQTHLLAKYLAERKSLESVLEDVTAALQPFEAKLLSADAEKKLMMEGIVNKVNSAVANVKTSLRALGAPCESVTQELTDQCQDILSDWLDQRHGHNVADNSIFAALPRKFEAAFFEDMDALNVLLPDVVTRVSEYVPEITDYIQVIIKNRFGYESNGSVYFDTVNFDNHPDHHYAKLVPEAYGDRKALQEGEGDLSVSEERLSEKRSENDFALWKASKPGEPSWESPWGKGRPGWHIECSVMASAILGSSVDIHTGGYDLKFPHHDNELAQAEAFFGNDHWVRYFLHSGHLTIAGCKMSKSLKNFVTIKDAIKRNTARQIRLAFLLHSWKDTLDYSDNTMDMAVQYERTVNEFFLNVKDVLRSAPTACRTELLLKWGAEERAFDSQFLTAQVRVHEALCDNVDTRSALEALRDLIASTNVYLHKKKALRQTPCRLLVHNSGLYVTRIMAVFGVAGHKQVGFSSTADENATVANKEDVALPYLNALAEFRDKIRCIARQDKANQILDMCDALRDDVLPALGVRLEDDEFDGSPPVIKFVDAETLLRERQQKLRLDEERRLEKERKRREQLELQAAKDALRRIPPADIFKSEAEKYSKYDEKGVPTHDAEGKELSKGQLKKLIKRFQEQEKRYNQYLQEENAKDIASKDVNSGS